MERTRFTRSAPRDEDDLDEMPSEEDLERFSDATRTCPECKKEVFDDSALCYHCGYAFDRASGAWGKTSSKQALWITLTALTLVGIMVFWLLRGAVF